MAEWGDYHAVSGAGWNPFWRIPDKRAGGLEIWWADFMGKRVLWKGSQPFASVPYHHPLKPTGGSSEPPPPEFTFKDGVGAICTGAPVHRVEAVGTERLKLQRLERQRRHRSGARRRRGTDVV